MPIKQSGWTVSVSGRHAAIWLTLLASLSIAGCGGGSLNTQPPPTKTTSTISAWPAASAIAYGQTLASSTLSGGTASVGGTFAWTTSSTAPGAGTPSESVTFTPNDTTDYNTATGSVTVTVNRASPTVSTWPTASAITYGQTLASSTLTGGSASVAGVFSWTTSSTAPGAGTYIAGVTFTPTDATDYNAVTGTTNVTVNQATPTITTLPTASAITYGQTLASSTLSGGSAAVPGTFAWTAPTTMPAATQGQSVTFTPTAAANYTTATGSVSVTVNAAKPTVVVSPGSSSVVSNAPLTVTVTVSGAVGTQKPTGSVTLSGGGYTSAAATTLTSGIAQITVPANSFTASGSVTLTASYTPDATSSSLYATATGTGSVTVTSATPYTLTVTSAAPSSGVILGVGPADNNSKTGGTTPFTLTYYGGTPVTLTAPLTANTYNFVSWTGCASTSGTSGSICSVTVNANTTVTATYNQSSITSVSVSPNAATIGSQQQFTATVNGTGSFSKSVTWALTCSSCGGLSPGTLSTSGLYNTPYPAPASVTITATSVQDTTKSGSATVTLNAPATASGPTLTVDVGTPSNPAENPHTISSYVYGMNGYLLDTASEKIANPGLIRWGGDATTRYNYQNNMANSASDYYFESFPGEGGMFPNAGSSSNFTQFFQGVDAAGSAALGTVPVNGWVTNSTQNVCSFTKTQFPAQQQFDPYHSNCGNGVLTNGTNLNGSSGTTSTQIPNITSIQEIPPDITNTSATPTSSQVPNPGTVTPAWASSTWSGGWVNSIVTNPSYGNGASGKGVAMWDLDNEPTWWDAVHRDVHPVAFTYDEVTNNGIGTALAIKTADPTALVSGPVIDYWEAYFYSKKDIENGWNSGPCYQPWSGPIDRTAHGGIPMIEYYLQQFAKYSGPSYYNMRLLDYLDVHSYFAPSYNGSSVGFTTAGDTQEQKTRLNGTRAFWDPTYTDPNLPQPNYVTDSNYTASCSTPLQAPQVIPMLKSWVAKDYPGTKTGIDEYNFGATESINGAVVEADILGIFGRQGLDMGAFWPTSGYSSQGPGNYAFAMYRNYDLANDGAIFGDVYLQATSMSSGADAENQLAIYGAQRSSDSAITVMVINKTYGPLTSTISLQNFTATSSTTAQVYQYSNANLNSITPQAALSVTPPSGSGTTSTISSYTFPPQSITLLVVP